MSCPSSSVPPKRVGRSDDEAEKGDVRGGLCRQSGSFVVHTVTGVNRDWGAQSAVKERLTKDIQSHYSSSKITLHTPALDMSLESSDQIGLIMARLHY